MYFPWRRQSQNALQQAHWEMRVVGGISDWCFVAEVVFIVSVSQSAARGFGGSRMQRFWQLSLKVFRSAAFPAGFQRVGGWRRWLSQRDVRGVQQLWRGGGQHQLHLWFTRRSGEEGEEIVWLLFSSHHLVYPTVSLQRTGLISFSCSLLFPSRCQLFEAHRYDPDNSKMHRPNRRVLNFEGYFRNEMSSGSRETFEIYVNTSL